MKIELNNNRIAENQYNFKQAKIVLLVLSLTVATLLLWPSQLLYSHSQQLLETEPSGTFNIAWLSNDVNETYSAALGDMDGDGDLDILVGNINEPNKIYRNNSDATFTDITSGELSNDIDATRSVAWGDMDGDGDLDILAGNVASFGIGQPTKVYRNEGDGVFVNITSGDLSSANYGTYSAVWGDMDGDGDLDILVGNADGSNKIYRNEGGGIFNDVTTGDLASNIDETYSVAWGDMDNDNDLDILVGNHGEPNAVYRNDGNSVFTEITGGDLAIDTDFTARIAWGDMDDDGDLDVLVGNIGVFGFGEQNRVYRNDGGGNFTDVTPSEIVGNPDVTYSVAWGDMDSDGDLDILVGNIGVFGFGEQNRVYRNDGSGNFTDVTMGDLATNIDGTYIAIWGDLDQDGDLDIFTGNELQPNQVYLNESGHRFDNITTGNLANDLDNTISSAWGDMDGDGDLDAVVGNLDLLTGGQTNRVYRNDEGVFIDVTAGDLATDQDNTASIAWGDMDGDGDLDLVAGNLSANGLGQINKVYQNEGGGVFNDITSGDLALAFDDTVSVAWGDMDGDEDLDILVGNWNNQANKIYRNDGNGEFNDITIGDLATHTSNTRGVAWGDMDNDGDLDIAIGNLVQPNKIYRNEGEGVFIDVTAGDLANDTNRTYGIAWGDMDGDGNLDILTGNGTHQNKVYRNEGGGVFNNVTGGDLEDDTDWTTSVAWADVDGDGDLDVLVGNYDGPNKIYRNDGGGVFDDITFGDMASDDFATESIAGGDVDGDGDIDILVGNEDGQPNQIYRNPRQNNSMPLAVPDLSIIDVSPPSESLEADLFSSPFIQTSPVISTVVKVLHSDLALTILNVFYSPNGGGAWYPAIPPGNSSEPLVTGAITQTITPIPIPDNGTVTNTLTFSGTQDIARLRISLELNHPANSQLQVVLSADWPTPGATQALLFDDLGGSGASYIVLDDFAEQSITATSGMTGTVNGLFQPVESLSIFDGMPIDTPLSLVITDTTSGNVGTLESWSIKSMGGVYTFYWDTFASGLFGQSDNVILRFVMPVQTADGVEGTFSYPNMTVNSFLYSAPSVTTFPFRVRGTQVQVYSESVGSGNEVKGAQVMRLPAGQTTNAFFMSDSFGQPYTTDHQGYLQGFGELAQGDHIVALLPITTTESYTLYYTSYAPETVSLGMHEVMTPGVQALTVSADNPLVVFNPTVSLEWDARGDGEFLSALDNAFQRASATLFDVTNGQAVLGNVRVHHNRENWVNADVVIHASGSIRPKASMGGVATDLITDTNRFGDPIPAAYSPGQVRMGTVWDPFGENTSELAEDWWLALAHELAHYYLYLPDNYLGLDPNGAFMTIDCAGSFMTNTYDDTYSELLNASEWSNDTACANDTFAANTTGRYDWATVTNFYPMLFEPASRLDGPVILPLDLANITIISPTTGITTSLPLPPGNIDLRDSGNNLLSLPSAQGYLFQRNGAGGEDDTLLSLGQANGDRLKVRGAQPGDTLCIFAPFDVTSGGAYLGCDDDFQATDSAVNLTHTPDWQPNIRVTAVTSMTLDVTVTLTSPLSNLSLQLFPAYNSHLDPTAPLVSPIAILTPTDGSNLVHVATASTTYPLFEGHIHIADSTDAYQAILPFYLNPPWGPMNRPIDMGPNTRAWGANARAFNAPIASGDGAVTIYNRDDVFGETGTFSLQGLASPPNLPSWMTPVGQGYRFVANLDDTTPISRTIAFDYLQRDVPAGYEFTLFIAYSSDEGQTWERLTTNLDTGDNLASAPMPTANDGQGIYVIVSSLALPPLEPGWNTMVYPFPVERPVEEALESIIGVLNRACDGTGTACYEAGVLDSYPEFADALNDLTTAPPFSTLQINVTEAITPFVGIEGSPIPLTTLTTPPATYFGWITPTAGFTPTVGMSVTAFINSTPCGQTTITDTIGTPGQLAYVLDVQADSGNGCGNVGETISFQVESWPLDHNIIWTNDIAQYHPLDTLLVVTPPLFSQGNVLFSTGGSGTIGDVRFRSEDIIGYDVRLDIAYHVIDGSDIGLRNANINAFTLLDDNSFLISVSQPVTLPVVGPIQTSDIVRFIPTRLGRATVGNYELFFTGSTFGLTENIDALHLSNDAQTLFISTAANAVGLGRDEDILAFDLNSSSWTRHFDGFDVGLSATTEDTNGIWYDALTSIWYLTTDGAFILPNLNGLGSDIFACLPIQLGEDTQCNFLSNLWVGTEAGLGGVSVDAFAIHR